MDYPKVVVIILNWNGWTDTIECLESLCQIAYPAFEIITVDNCSENESVEKIKSYALGDIRTISAYFEYAANNKPIEILEYTEEELEKINFQDKTVKNPHSNGRIIIIKTRCNHGFAGGNNIGIRYALNTLNPKYIMLLNNDTIVDNKSISKLVEVSEKDEKIAILGPVSYQYDGNTKNREILSFGGEINWKKYPGYHDIYHKINENLTNLDKNRVIECDWVSGAAMMIKNDNKIPIYLDNKFFFGCEDADLCIRSRCKGYKVVAVFGSKIWHKFGVSRNKRYKDKIERFFVNIKTNFKFNQKHNKYFFIYLPIYLIQIATELFENYILEKIRD